MTCHKQESDLHEHQGVQDVVSEDFGPPVVDRSEVVQHGIELLACKQGHIKNAMG